jgi:hypothetical protein
MWHTGREQGRREGGRPLFVGRAQEGDCDGQLACGSRRLQLPPDPSHLPRLSLPLPSTHCRQCLPASLAQVQSTTTKASVQSTAAAAPSSAKNMRLSQAQLAHVPIPRHSVVHVSSKKLAAEDAVASIASVAAPTRWVEQGPGVGFEVRGQTGLGKRLPRLWLPLPGEKLQRGGAGWRGVQSFFGGRGVGGLCLGHSVVHVSSTKPAAEDDVASIASVAAPTR